MDHVVEDDGDDIYIYRGGRAPLNVTITHARIDKSVDEIEGNAFRNCVQLEQVDTHDGISKIGANAFYRCTSLRRINLKSAVEIGEGAFYICESLESTEFGDYLLETIGYNAFNGCRSLTHLKLPSIIDIGISAFSNCKRLIDVELSERLESIEGSAFYGCERLQRIAIPLKRDIFALHQVFQRYNQFDYCDQLTTVDLVGGIDKTVASLHMKSWRAEMIAEINRINQVLPNTPANEKTEEIRQWLDLISDKMDHYEVEHRRYVKEGVTLLELALWKAKLCEKEDYAVEGRKTKKAKVDADAESYRRDKRITCGADMVIKNVLPFLQLE